MITPFHDGTFHFIDGRLHLLEKEHFDEHLGFLDDDMELWVRCHTSWSMRHLLEVKCCILSWKRFTFEHMSPTFEWCDLVFEVVYFILEPLLGALETHTLMYHGLFMYCCLISRVYEI
jgi:hypothetical protein